MCKARPAPRCEDHAVGSYASAVLADEQYEEGSKAKAYAEKRRDRWASDLRVSLGGRLAKGESAEVAAKALDGKLRAQFIEAGKSDFEARSISRSVLAKFRENPGQYQREWETRTSKAKGGRAFMTSGVETTSAPRLAKVQVVVEKFDEEAVSVPGRVKTARTTANSEIIDRAIKGEDSRVVLEALATNPNASKEQLMKLWVRVNSEKHFARKDKKDANGVVTNLDSTRKTSRDRISEAIQGNENWDTFTENRAVVEVDAVEKKKQTDIAKRIARGGMTAARASTELMIHEMKTADDFNVLHEGAKQGKRAVKLAVLGNKAVAKATVMLLANDTDTNVKSAARKHSLYEDVKDELAARREKNRERQRAHRERKKKEALEGAGE